MSDAPQSPAEQRVQELIADYLEAARTGQAPPREQWLADHPDLADDLKRFLDNHDHGSAVTG